MVKLGSRQKSCLETLVQRGAVDCGGVWKMSGETERVMNTLVAHGLATRRHVLPRFGYSFYRYEPTPEGVALMKEPGGRHAEVQGAH